MFLTRVHVQKCQLRVHHTKNYRVQFRVRCMKKLKSEIIQPFCYMLIQKDLNFKKRKPCYQNVEIGHSTLFKDSSMPCPLHLWSQFSRLYHLLYNLTDSDSRSINYNKRRQCGFFGFFGFHLHLRSCCLPAGNSQCEAAKMMKLTRAYKKLRFDPTISDLSVTKTKKNQC